MRCARPQPLEHPGVGSRLDLQQMAGDILRTAANSLQMPGTQPVQTGTLAQSQFAIDGRAHERMYERESCVMPQYIGSNQLVPRFVTRLQHPDPSRVWASKITTLSPRPSKQ